MTDEQKVIAALERLVGRKLATATSATTLRDDLGLDSANLIDLTVLVHGMYGVDLGRKSAEAKLLPLTVGDLATLLGMP